MTSQSTPSDSLLTLRAAVTREEAADTFAAGLGGAVRSWRLGPLQLIADVYVPFRLFHVEIRSGRTREEQILAIDAVAGTLDLYGFDRAPADRDLLRVTTSNRVRAQIDEKPAAEALRERLRRTILQRKGFFRAGCLQIEARPLIGELHIPYWVGFFGRGDEARMAVIDAVRRRIEGPKVRRLLESALMSV